MKRKNFFPLLATMVVVAVSCANAQIGNGVRADVPFAFTVAHETFPAGQYTVRKMGATEVLSITGSGSAITMASSQPVQSRTEQKLTKLVFHRYGDRYFLYQVWVRGEDRGQELPPTKVERELASSRQPNSVAVLALK
jgi:hypothetical protein